MIFTRGGQASASHPRKNPRAAGRAGDLKFDKRSRSQNFILFCELEREVNEEGHVISGDEIASRIHHQTKGRAERPAFDDIVRAARKECARCHEAISGSSPRHIHVTVRLECVGAEFDGATVETICNTCHSNGAPAAVAAPEPVLDIDDWKVDLSPRQREAWERVEERHEHQRDSANAMKVSQPAISQLLAAARKVRDHWRAANKEQVGNIR